MTGQLLNSFGWLTSPLFTRIDGHPTKRYTELNTGDLGIACHSIVGEEPDFMDGIPNRFLSDEREPGNPARFTENAAASVMFVLRKRMPHVQMYDVHSSTWTSGGREANCNSWAIEAEGGAPGNEGEPLTPHQEAGFLAIAHAWLEFRRGGWSDSYVNGKTLRAYFDQPDDRRLWQHKDLARRFGYAPTACASDRYAHAWRRLLAGDTPDQEETQVPELTEARVKEIAEDAAGGVFLPLLEQLLDLKPETFSDDETLARVRRALAAQRTINLGNAKALADAIGRIADGAVEAHAQLAALVEGAE